LIFFILMEAEPSASERTDLGGPSDYGK